MCNYLATEAATPVNGPVGGTVRGYRGPTVVMLSAVDGPLGPSVAAVHGPGRPSGLPHLVRGGDCRGTIGSVTEHEDPL